MLIDEKLLNISDATGIDFKQFDLDAPLTPIEARTAGEHEYNHMAESAPPGATLREIVDQQLRRNSVTLIGTADEIADQIGRLGDELNTDGFLLKGQVHPQRTQSARYARTGATARKAHSYRTRRRRTPTKPSRFLNQTQGIGPGPGPGACRR